MAVGADVEPDPDMVARLEPRAEQVRARAERVVGQLATPLDKAPRGTPESTLGNWVTDAIRRQMEKETGRELDICFTNNGGLRRSLPEGPVTEGMLVELMPFDNAIVVLDVSGARLRRILGHLAQTGDPASGVTYARGEDGPTEIEVGGEPLDEERSYAVCTNDYLYEGGGGYDLGDIEQVTYTGVLLRDVLIADFEQAQARGEPITGALDGRARDRESQP